MNDLVENVTANQYLTFLLDGEHYAFNVGRIREVMELARVTRLPRMPAYMEGVLNIRGEVLPVVDLRTKFGMARAEATVDTAVIVTDVQLEQRMIRVGCRTDAVDEVIDIDPQTIEPAPRLGTAVRADFVSGIGRKDDSFIIILDIDRIFRDDELAAIDGAVEHPA